MDKSPKEIYAILRPWQRKLIASRSFRDGYFTPDGELACGCVVCGQGEAIPWGGFHGQGPPTRYEPCENLEFLCEVMAAIILVQNPTHDCSEKTARLCGAEPWVLRFRQAIG